jgi:uncharacterized protein
VPSLDTNILLRLLLDDIPEQRQAVLRLISQYDKLALADLAITEAVFVLEKPLRMRREIIIGFIRSLLDNQHLNFNRSLFAGAIELYAVHSSLSFNDCCLAVYSELTSASPLYTFDVDLSKKSGGRAQLVTT